MCLKEIRKMKKRLVLLLVISVLITVGCGAKDSEVANETPEVLEAIPVSEDIINVDIEAVSEQSFVDILEISGEVAPAEQVLLSSKISGDIRTLKVDVGDYVLQSGMLIQFDGTQFALEKERASLNVQSAEVRFNEAQSNYEKHQKLYEAQAISTQEFESVKSQYELLNVALKSARASYKIARTKHADAFVKAPIAGYISERKVSVGEHVNPGAKLLTIVNTDKVYLEAGISEQAVNHIIKDMKVNVTIESLGQEIFEGVVTHIGPVPSGNNTYPVKVLIENPQHLIKPGMFAGAKVELSAPKMSVAVSKSAVMHEGNGYYVMVVEEDQAKKMNVEVGTSSDDYFEIISGLSVGDQLIVRGHDMASDGDLIKVN